MQQMRGLAQHLIQHLDIEKILIWDRINSGNAYMDFSDSHHFIHKDALDLAAILTSIRSSNTQFALYGCSSGGRLSAYLATFRPDLGISTLILAPPTGGEPQCQRIIDLYYKDLLKVDSIENLPVYFRKMLSRTHQAKVDFSGLQESLHKSIAFANSFKHDAMIGVHDEELFKLGSRLRVLVMSNADVSDHMHTWDAAKKVQLVSQTPFPILVVRDLFKYKVSMHGVALALQPYFGSTCRL